MTDSHPFAPYVRQGWCLVPVWPGTQKPMRQGWNTREQTIDRIDELTPSIQAAALAHAYSGTCALDIDALATFRDWWSAQGGTWDELYGDEAVIVASGRPDRSKLLFSLPEPKPSVELIPGQGREIAALHCASAAGLTHKDMLPPSLHPDTGQPYAWQYTDETIADWRILPPLPRRLAALWDRRLAQREPAVPPIAAAVATEDLADLLSGRDPDLDYPEWIRIGMSLHHASGGSAEGRALWQQWSSQGQKYRGEGDIARHWASFRDVPRPVTVGSLRRDAVPKPEDFAAPSAPSAASPTAALPESPPEASRRFPIVSLADLQQSPPVPWLIDRLIPQSDLVLLYGPPSVGKSFLALDLAFAVARGVPFFGRDVAAPAPVVWIAAEGAYALKTRARAYAQACGDAFGTPAFWVVLETPRLHNGGDATALVQAMAEVRPSLVIVDTLAAASVGADENSGQDMGQVVASCQSLTEAYGTVVLLVHHSGKDISRGPRGWSGLRAAVSTELCIDMEGPELRVARVTKQRDAEDGISLYFRLEPIALGVDDRTSCVVLPQEDPAADLAAAVRTPPISGLTDLQRRVWATVQQLRDTVGERLYSPEVYAHLLERDPPPPPGTPDRRKSYIRTALRKLSQKELIHFDKDFIIVHSVER